MHGTGIGRDTQPYRLISMRSDSSRDRLHVVTMLGLGISGLLGVLLGSDGVVGELALDGFEIGHLEMISIGTVDKPQDGQYRAYNNGIPDKGNDRGRTHGCC